MASTNVQQITSASLFNQAVVVDDSTIARPINLTPGWTAVKLGVYYLISGSAGPISGSPRFCMGLSSGSNILGDASPDFFMGYRTNQLHWSYVSSSANTREFYTYTNAGIRIIKGGTAVSTSTDIIIGATARSERVCGVYKPSMATLLITKLPALPGYRFQAVVSNASAGYSGTSSSSFYKDMETTDVEATFFTVTSSIYEASASQDIVFDKAIFAWNKSQLTASIAVLDFAITTFR